MPLSKKLCLVFIVIFLFSMALVAITSGIVTSKLSREKINSHASQILREIDHNLEYVLIDCENISRFIIYNDQINSMLLTPPGSADYREKSGIARDILINAILYKDYVESISVYSLTGESIIVGFSPSYMTDYETIASQPWFELVPPHEGMFLWEYSEFFNDLRGNNENRVLLSRMINEKVSHKPIGSLVIMLKNEYINGRLAISDEFTNSAICVTDAGGRLIAPRSLPHGIPAGELLDESRQGAYMFRFENQSYLVTQYRMHHIDWMLSSITDGREAYSEQYINLRNIIIVTLITVVIAFFVYTRFTRSLIDPINAIVEGMENAEDEDFKKMIVISRGDEIGRLGKAYNGLISRINFLVNEVLRGKLQNQQAELENLQAQINPHFLYNTLECINWKALGQDQVEISEMIAALSKMFRSNLSGNTNIVTLDQELESIRTYLFLQKKRYEDNLTVEIDAPGRFLDRPVLRFILQPIVENSILHGIETHTGKSIICINVAEKEEGFVVSIIDNGPGVKIDEIAAILSGETGEGDENRQRHGIYNVNQRLKLHYGEGSGLFYSNPENGGTRVDIFIPPETKGGLDV
jgi:two-component system sensor histidine kinase YesM